MVTPWGQVLCLRSQNCIPGTQESCWWIGLTSQYLSEEWMEIFIIWMTFLSGSRILSWYKWIMYYLRVIFRDFVIFSGIYWRQKGYGVLKNTHIHPYILTTAAAHDRVNFSLRKHLAMSRGFLILTLRVLMLLVCRGQVPLHDYHENWQEEIN